MDHDFPEPHLDAFRPLLPFDVTMVRHIDHRLVEDKEDWQVILAVHQRGYSGLITLDYKMLNLPREMAVLHQVRGTLVPIEAVGDNPIRAIGQLLVQAAAIAHRYVPDQPQIFRIPAPRAVQPISAWDRLGEIASHSGRSIQQVFHGAQFSDAELREPVV